MSRDFKRNRGVHYLALKRSSSLNSKSCTKSLLSFLCAFHERRTTEILCFETHLCKASGFDSPGESCSLSFGISRLLQGVGSALITNFQTSLTRSARFWFWEVGIVSCQLGRVRYYSTAEDNLCADDDLLLTVALLFDKLLTFRVTPQKDSFQ
jgi:hypothetical protein